ncbi:amidohydrolase family protein [Ruania zhangjianzhongii]|uniref:amidohydrolase family protein n=1 Tax=Ruania zhangjianzhongii TaxID=2603206 RepID=UPI0011CB6532|nr:amidohydrolase family protein [Ruania zhangjianzhongii]
MDSGIPNHAGIRDGSGISDQPRIGPEESVHLRARVLPDGEETELWISGGVISRSPVPGARTIVTGGWVLPALVDAHLHVGVAEIGGPLDLDVLAGELALLARSGIGAARILGSPSTLPDDVLSPDGGPLLQHAGVPLAAPDRFIPGWGELVSGDGLTDACAERRGSGWLKIIADWFDDTGSYSAAFDGETLSRAIAAAHESGHRVAVHTQSADGGRSAVLAGADSIEHGMHLPMEVLPDLAARRGVLVPTGTVFEQLAESMASDEVPPELRRWYSDGVASHPELVRRAWESGVTVLAGTDLPVGALIDEVEWLIAAGLPVGEAIGAASWTAREVLDLPRLRDGDRADLIWTEDDPRTDPGRLRAPDLVILSGSAVG